MSFIHTAPRGPFSPSPTRRAHQTLRYLALAVVLALGAIPTAAWAKAPGQISAEVSPIRPATPVPMPTEARTSQGQEYASREASAASQAKFEGGSTTVWIGGSTLVIVLLLILIVVVL
jgi:hypothetical protein